MSASYRRASSPCASLRFLALIGALLWSQNDAAQASPDHPEPAFEGEFGYQDTPVLPGSQWRVNDSERPSPRIVTPGRVSANAPSDALILFDGSDLSAFVKADGTQLDWPLEHGAVTVPARKNWIDLGPGMTTLESFGDVQLHVEFRTPLQVEGRSQQRGNSGILFMQRYEVQILDSFDNPTYADGQAAALYGWKPPLVNASRPPGEWQAYDIIFERPHFSEDGTLAHPAYATVFHNGVLVQNRQRFLGVAGWKTLASYSPHADALPIEFQDHASPVSFRNIWVRRLTLDEKE